jgi:uncharacterized repeat protein (TIGR03803 family)
LVCLTRLGIACKVAAPNEEILLCFLQGAILHQIRSVGFGASSFTTLWNFDRTNGAVPEATLIRAADEFLYGTTIGGGTNDLVHGGFGTVFRISTNGDLTSLLSFPPEANPQSGVVQAASGEFLAESRFYGVKDSR